MIVTNSPHKNTSIGVFPNDISNHCSIACVRNTKMIEGKGSNCHKTFLPTFLRAGLPVLMEAFILDNFINYK